MLTEFDKNYFYMENQKRKILKQGEHLILTINSENGEVFALIDEFKGQVKGELWGIKREHLKKAKTIVENGIEFTEIELHGLFTYYSDKTINIITETGDWDKYKGLKHHDDIASASPNICLVELDDIISIQHWLALSSEKEMWVKFKDGTKVICKIDFSECKE
jgi:hypothetical protein